MCSSVNGLHPVALMCSVRQLLCQQLESAELWENRICDGVETWTGFRIAQRSASWKQACLRVTSVWRATAEAFLQCGREILLKPVKGESSTRPGHEGSSIILCYGYCGSCRNRIVALVVFLWTVDHHLSTAAQSQGSGSHLT